MPIPFSASTISSEAPHALKLCDVKKVALLAGPPACSRCCHDSCRLQQANSVMLSAVTRCWLDQKHGPAGGRTCMPRTAQLQRMAVGSCPERQANAKQIVRRACCGTKCTALT